MMLIASQTGSPWPLLGGMLGGHVHWLSSMGLAYEYSTGLRQVALFTAADQFRPLLFLICNVVSQPLMPLVTSQVKKAEHGETEGERKQARRHAQRAIERSFQLVACLILPIHALLAFAGPYVMALFGRSFATEWTVFLTMLAFAAYTGIASLATHTLTALSRVWTLNIMQIVFGIMLIAITYLLRSWGAIGLGLAYFIATFCSLSITTVILHRADYVTWFAILVQLAAFVWLLLLSFISAFTPASWRPFCIPIAFLATVLMIFLTMRTEMMYVIEMLRRKLGR
jgi:O-antigen/teichoic acid export membrane protein